MILPKSVSMSIKKSMLVRVSFSSLDNRSRQEVIATANPRVTLNPGIVLFHMTL